MKSGRVVQSVSTPACHAGGRGFEPLHGRQIMPQMKVCGIKNAAIAQMVEHVIGNDEVSSSNLLSSSKIPITKVVGIFSFYASKENAPDGNCASGVLFVYSQPSNSSIKASAPELWR